MDEFDRLVRIVEVLRSPKGCPWDREQTLESIVENIIEEAYEVVHAISNGDYKKIKEETGDLILQGVFISQIAKEMGKFSIDEVLRELNDKVISRHPHVFGNEKTPETMDEALRMWEGKKSESNDILNEIPHNFPTLLYIYKVVQKGKRKSLIRVSEDEICSKVKKFMERIDLNNNDEVEDLVTLLLVLLSYRNVRTEVRLREKFLNLFEGYL